MGLTTTELARELNLSKGRISQYVSSGVLDGCFEGSGRQRRFDLHKVARALGRKLDPGQMMGNGASTQEVLQGLDRAGTAAPKARGHAGGATELGEDDDDRYQLARTLKAEEEARRLRRQNAEAEGNFVLASEVRLQVQKQIGQEIAEFESVMREAARRLADECPGVDFKQARAVLVDCWRAHRARRSAAVRQTADAGKLTETEKNEDI